MKHKLKLKVSRWVLAFATGVCASYLGTYLYGKNIAKIADLTGLTTEQLCSIPYVMAVFIVILGGYFLSIYAFRDVIKRYLYIYPHMGGLVSQASIKTIITSSTFDDPSLFSQLKNDVNEYLSNAKQIDLLLISGAQRKRDPFEDYVLSEVSKEMRKKRVRVYLLDYRSKYLKMRAKERFQAKNEIETYEKGHTQSIRELKDIFGAPKIVFYDELPIWRIFRFGNMMYVSQYMDGLSAIESLMIGYVKPHANPCDIQGSPFHSFIRYLEHLNSKNEQDRSPIEYFVLAKISDDVANGHPLSCNCYRCYNDILNLVHRDLKTQGISFDKIESGIAEAIYAQARKTVFNNKRCCY